MHSQAYDASYTLESAYVLYLLWAGMTAITCVSAAQGCSVVPFRLISTFLKESVCVCVFEREKTPDNKNCCSKTSLCKINPNYDTM